MTSLDQRLNISRPVILVDENRVRQNIAHMAEKARRSGVAYRPHFKTHQSARIGSWFRDYGVEKIAVASVEMAAYFGRNGWQDITIAFPVNLRQLNEISALARQVNLHLMVETAEAVQALDRALDTPVGVWVNVDTGQAREGLDPADWPALKSVAEAARAARQLRLEGILSHFGHSYQARGKAAVSAVYRDGIERMIQLRERFDAAGWPDLALSVGDTPCCSLVDDLSQTDEIRPGTNVFYDLRQMGVGACSEDQIAITAACPVVGVNRARSEVIIYGGAAHLSKDFNPNPDGERNYGGVARLTETGWAASLPGCYLASVSQEIGIIKMTPEEIGAFRVGDLVLILPAHACLMVNAMRRYLTLENEAITCLPLGPVESLV